MSTQRTQGPQDLRSRHGNQAALEDQGGGRRRGGRRSASAALLTPLTRAILRRERRSILAWSAGQALLALYCVLMLDAAYSTPQERQAAALTYTTPAASLFTGPGYGLERSAPTFGALFAAQALGWLVLVVALMGVLQAIARTRGDEDAGPAELLAAAPTRRGESAWAALISAALTGLGMGALSAIAAIIGGLAPGQSMLLGAALSLVGLSAAGAGLVLAALAPSARAARGAGLLLVLAWFTLRGLGDASEPGSTMSRASWLSPIGLVQQARLYVDLRWEPLVILAAIALATTAAGLALHRRRQLAQGLVPALGGGRRHRRGPDGAHALARRTTASQRRWWGLGGLAFGATYGLFAPTIESSFQQVLADNPSMQAFFGGELSVQVYLALIIGYGGILAGACAVALMGAAVGEESSGLSATVLALPVSRGRWLLARLQVLVLGALAVLVGIGVGLAGSALPALAAQDSPAMEDPWRLALGLGAGLAAQLPAALLAGALMGAVQAVAPRWARALGWGAYALWLSVFVLGPAAQAPQWLLNLSPWTHLPSLPAAEGAVLGEARGWVGPAVCLVLALVLVGMAAVLGNRRDLRN